MKKITMPLIAFLFLVSLAKAQTKNIFSESAAAKQQRMAWWTNDRFGMFIHWGIYSMAARHEWVKHNEHMTNEEYQKYFDLFNPDLFDPIAWAKQAKAAGMKYAVLTTKHHDGFCLFDSKFTDYKATNTPAHRDLVREYVNAFRAQGLRVGFYYSLLDWHHPDYTMDNVHPLTQTDTSQANYDRMNKGRDMRKYRQYLRDQITELLTNYGKIDILWLDWTWDKNDKRGKHAEDWGAVELLKLVRKLQPGILVNNRLGLDEFADGGDFVTPEQVSPTELTKYRGKTWETCQTFSGSWGYYRDENSWKTDHQLLDLLVTSTANGGNLILNVGPTARGEFDYRAKNALDSLSYWMHANSKAIYQCTYAPEEYKAPENARLTYNKANRRLYLHLMEYPETHTIVLQGYKDKIRYTQFLHDASEIRMKENGDDVTLLLPDRKPNVAIPVIEILLK